MKSLFERKVEVCVFSPGDRVLANLPLAGSPFQARFLGFDSVKCWVSDVNYLISTPDRRKSMDFLSSQSAKTTLFLSR